RGVLRDGYRIFLWIGTRHRRSSQNVYRSAAMTLRLPPSVPHWFRKFDELIRPSGIPKFRVFVALYISKRSCTFCPSLIRVFFTKPTSTLPIPSARRVLRPTLPVRT